VLGGHQAWLRALPVDPGLQRFPGTPVVGRGGRLVAVDFVASVDPGEVVATRTQSVLLLAGRATAACRRVLFARRCSGARTDAQAPGTTDHVRGLRSDRPAPRHQALHNGTARQLRRALRRQPGIVITKVPHHLPICTGHSHMPMA
jgi:hypothetical protein